MSPLEAYLHIRGILEDLNAVVAEQFASLLLEKSVSDKNRYSLIYIYFYFRLIKKL
jgi:hypothetical protein